MKRLTREIWDTVVRVNLNAAYYITAAVLPAMRARGAGHLIYISSVSGLFADVSGAPYQASKRDLLGQAIRRDPGESAAPGRRCGDGALGRPAARSRLCPRDAGSAHVSVSQAIAA